MGEAKRKTPALVAEIDADELAVKLMSIGIGAYPTAAEKRSNREIIQATKDTWPPGCGPFPFDRMAHAAIMYMADCIRNGSKPQ
jgi:hypothetical protein